MPVGKTNSLDTNSLKCVELIKKAKTIGALTGAGISTSAGIPDFRGPQGLYVTRRYDPDTVFDINYFLEDPKPFFQFARDFVGLEEKIQPTVAHHFLSHLEEMGKLRGVITQNIDCLHQRAGSQNVLELHGSFENSSCLECDKNFSYEEMKKKLFIEEIPQCSCGGVIKPDVVFFGENVKFLEEAYALAEVVDLFFVIGTSCVVYPAAMIPNFVKGDIVIVNISEVRLNSPRVVLSVQEDINDFFKKVEECLKN